MGFLNIAGGKVVGLPLPLASGLTTPTPMNVVGTVPAVKALSILPYTLRGVNFNNADALYLESSAYNETTGLTFSAYGTTRTANALNAGPVWNRFTEDGRDFAQVARWGANYIAFGIDWHWYGFTALQHAAFLALLDQVVAWCKTYGLRVSFRLFVPRGGFYAAGSSTPTFGTLTTWETQDISLATPAMLSVRDMWLAIATHFTNEPTVCGYDLLNEPWTMTGYAYDVWFPYAGYLVDQIQLVDPNHYCIVQSDSSQQFYSHPKITKPGQRIVFSSHTYVPLSFTTPDPSGPFWTYPGFGFDYDSVGASACNGNQLASGNINMAGLWLPNVAGQVAIDNELITHNGLRAWQGGDPGASTDSQGRTAQILLVTARGASGTVAATHTDKTGIAIAASLNSGILIGDVMSGAGTVTVDTTAGFPAAAYFTMDQEDFTYTSKTGTTFNGVTRATDGTTAQAHSVGAIIRNGRYWSKTTINYIFGINGRFNMVPPMDWGEFGTKKRTGYMQLVADQIDLFVNTPLWISPSGAVFVYREWLSDGFGLTNGNDGGAGWLSLNPISSAGMSSGANCTPDTTMINYIKAYWFAGNPTGRTV